MSRPVRGSRLTITLSEFLLARIADELQHAFDYGRLRGVPMSLVVATHQVTAEDDPVRRVFVECEARRKIVEHIQNVSRYAGDPPGVETESLSAFTYILRLLALPYADHPDWQEGWRP